MTLWIIWALVVSTLFGMAAHIGESALRGTRRQGRWVWVMAMLGSTLLPAWYLTAPRASPTLVEPAGSGSADAGLDRVVSSVWVDIDAVVAPMFDQRFDERLDTYVIAAWIAASALLMTGLLAGSWRLRRKAATWPRRRLAGHDVLVSEDFGPAVFGVRSPFIVVPHWLLDHGEDTVRLVCMHEAEHRAAGDTALLTGAAILAAAMPWNVVLWWQVSRLRSAIELDCDERVIAAGAPRTAYARILLDIGAGTEAYGLVMTRFTQSATLLERRLTMLIARGRKRGPAKTVASLVAVVGLTAVGCAVQAPAESPAPEPPIASPEPPVASDNPAVVNDTGVTGAPAERHPSVFDNLPPAGNSAVGVVPYRPVVRGGVVPYRPVVMGMGSIRLYFIDGEQVEPFDWRALDPNDIESIEIIKGAAAANLFGPEAWDGVVTVVTKRN